MDTEKGTRGPSDDKNVMKEEKGNTEEEEESEDHRRMPPDEDVKEGDSEPTQIQINVMLRDGSVQPLLVSPRIEIYDLVRDVAYEIGILIFSLFHASHP